MKKTNKLLLGLLLTLPVLGFSQQEKITTTKLELKSLEITKYDHADGQKHDYRFWIVGHEIINDQLNIYTRLCNLGLISKLNNKINFASGNTYAPALAVSSFSLDNDDAFTKKIALNLNDFTGKTWGKYTIMGASNETGFGDIGSSETDATLEKIKEEYPGSIRKNTGAKDTEEFTHLFFNYGKIRKSYLTKNYFSASNNTYYGTTSTRVEKEEFSFSGEPKIFQGKNYAYNPYQQSITRLESARRKGKEFKWNEYKEYAFVTYTETGKIENSALINFNFVRDDAYLGFAKDYQNQKGNVVCLFGQRAYQKKYNNPDFSKYQAVVLNTDGSLKYKHEFSFEGKKRELLPKLSNTAGETHYLYDLALGQDVKIIKIDKTGASVSSQKIETIKFAGDKVLAKKFYFIYSKCIPLKTIELSNGNVLHTYERKIQTQREVKDPATNQITTPALYDYSEFYAVELNVKDNNVAAIYAIKRPMKLRSTSMDYHVFETGEELIFTFNERIRKKTTPVDHKLYQFAESQDYAEKSNGYICRPIIVTLNYTDKSMTTYKPSDKQFISLYGNNPYTFIPETKTLYIVGIKDEQVVSHIQYQLIKLKF